MTDEGDDVNKVLAPMAAVANELCEQRIKAMIDDHTRRGRRRTEPQEVRVDVPLEWGDASDDDMDSKSVPLVPFVRGLMEALGSIPEEYRDTAKYEADWDWEEPTSLGSGGVTYTRMETPEEVVARLAEYDERVANDVRREMASELALYHQLRAKYEGR